MNRSDVYIVGGGFAGVAAARAVTREAPDAEVHVLDATGYATMVPALPDIVSGRIRPEALRTPLSTVMGPAVSTRTATVTEIDLEARLLRTATSEHRYDYLILAHGSAPAFHGFRPEDGTIHGVHSFAAARVFRSAVEAHLGSNPEAPVVIVGAGYTGLEVASCLTLGARDAHWSPRIVVVEVADVVLPMLSARERGRLLDYFASIGVDVRTETSVERYADGVVELSDGSRLRDALLCWAAGMQAQPTPLHGTPDRARDGRLHTNAFLQLPSHPRTFAAGDAALIRKDGVAQRRAVNFSVYSGRRAGQNVAAALNGNALRAFRPVDLGWIIPIGEQSVGRLAGRVPVFGRTGLRLHYAMCGFRQFTGGGAGEYYRTALRLGRRAAPLSTAKEAPDAL
ncbi:MAG: NAD(P)/FAD-dependent oxidoreductase [Spirochaetaceae bacterium]